MYFSVFTPWQLNFPSNFSLSFVVIKWLDPFKKSIGIFSGILYFKLHILCAAALYLPL